MSATEAPDDVLLRVTSKNLLSFVRARLEGPTKSHPALAIPRSVDGSTDAARLREYADAAAALHELEYAARLAREKCERQIAVLESAWDAGSVSPPFMSGGQ